MKVIILFCIMTNFVCDIHYLKKNEHTNNIYPKEDSYGLIILDITEFNEEESIYNLLYSI